MNPEMHNDPGVIFALAMLAWATYAAVETRVARKRRSRDDAPRETTWRNRWH